MNRSALLLLPLLLGHCAWTSSRLDLDRPAKNREALTAQRWEGRQRQQDAYQDGLADGETDRARDSARDYTRHGGRYDARTEEAYRQGYDEGYDKSAASGPVAKLTAEQQAARDTGYAAGVRDLRMSRGADPDSHASSYDQTLSSWFLDGYQEGFEGR